MNIYKTNSYEIVNQEISHVEAELDVKNHDFAVDSAINAGSENEHDEGNNSGASSNQHDDTSSSSINSKSHPLGSQASDGHTVTNGRSSHGGKSGSNLGGGSSGGQGQSPSGGQGQSSHGTKSDRSSDGRSNKNNSSAGDFDLNLSTDKVQVNCHVHQTDQKQRSGHGAVGGQSHNTSGQNST